MRDPLSKERRSWNMSRIRGKDTSPEMAVRRLLHRMGYRFRLHVRIPFVEGRGLHHGGHGGHGGKHRAKDLNRRALRSRRSAKPKIRFIRPDIVLPKYKTVIFVHGCFWHRHRGCKNCTTPTNRREWWMAKLEGNAARDKVHRRALRRLGWRVTVLWECEVESVCRPAGLIHKLGRVLRLSKEKEFIRAASADE